MILVTKIDYKETPNPAMVKTLDNNILRVSDFSNASPSPNEPLNIREEIIHGVNFIDFYGNKITIGMTEEVSNILGEPFRVIDILNNEAHNREEFIKMLIDNHEDEVKNMIRDIYTLDKRNTELSNKYTSLKLKYENMSLWERVKYVFNF